MKKIAFHWQILIGMVLGTAFGYILPGLVHWVAPIGTIFIRLLKLIVIPLIFFSVTDGILRAGSMQRISTLGGKTVGYYLGTNCLAVFVSLILVNLIQPGKGVELFGENPLGGVGKMSIMDFIPENIFASFASGSTLHIIFVAIFLGIFLLLSQGKGPTLVSFFKEGNELLLRITQGLIKLAPIGVFGLMAAMVDKIDMSALMGIGKFALTIILSLLVHAFVTIPIIFKLFSGRSVMDYAKKMRPALLTAFSTSSSAATLPLTLECVEEKAKVPKETSGFVLPIGATVNMDGTAMYESVACLFIAQALGIELALHSQIIVFFTASLAAIGAAAIPSAGLVTLTIVLTAVGLPLEGIGLLLAIDRPLDMSRTVVNVWGDMVGCAVVEGKK